MTATAPRVFCYPGSFSVFYFYPFGSFYFSCGLSHSLRDSFVHSGYTHAPSQRSNSVHLCSPIELHVSLLFSFVYSSARVRSVELHASVSVSCGSISREVFTRDQAVAFFSVSIALSVPLSIRFGYAFQTLVYLFYPFRDLEPLGCQLRLFSAGVALWTLRVYHFLLRSIGGIALLRSLVYRTTSLLFLPNGFVIRFLSLFHGLGTFGHRCFCHLFRFLRG